MIEFFNNWINLLTGFWSNAAQYLPNSHQVLVTAEKVGIIAGVWPIILAGLVGFFGKHVQVLFSSLFGWIVDTRLFGQQDEFRENLFPYLNKHYRKLPHWGAKKYVTTRDHIRSLGRIRSILLRYLGQDICVFMVGWSPLLIVSTPGTNDPGLDWGTRVMFLRGTIRWDELVKQAFEEGDQRATETTYRNRFEIIRIKGASYPNNAYISASAPKSRWDNDEPETRGTMFSSTGWTEPLWWKREDIGPPQSDKAIEHLALTPDLTNLVEEIRFWRKSEDWYKARRIPWKRGYLFHGLPGTGKTAMIRAVAEDLDLPVYLYDLASLHNHEFIEGWGKTVDNAPCIAAFEDLDGVFDGRRNVIDEKALSFDCLLNSIDGVQKTDGVLLIITTNCLEKIDPAIGIPTTHGTTTRPGRIDHTVLFTGLDQAGRHKLANQILCDHRELVEKAVFEGADDSAAQFQERCFKLATINLFEQKA